MGVNGGRDYLVDFAEWIGIGLGVLAVAIAVWDNLRDRFYMWRGPVRATLAVFDIPQPNLRLVDGEPGICVRMSWTCLNRLSWPVLATFPLVYKADGEVPFPKAILRDELYQTSGSSVYLPPRQPVVRTLWVAWPLDKCGEIVPSFDVFSGRGQHFSGPTRTLTWTNGRPSLGG